MIKASGFMQFINPIPCVMYHVSFCKVCLYPLRQASNAQGFNTNTLLRYTVIRLLDLMNKNGLGN